MKKITLCLMLIIAILIVPGVILASENIAKVENTEYATLEEAINVAKESGDEIVLLSDAELSGTVSVTSGKVTINLNGYKITGKQRLFDVKGAEFTVKGYGSLEETSPNYAPICVKGSNNSNDNNYTVINVGSDVILKSWAGIMVSPYDSKTQPYAYGVVINCDGTINSVKDTSGYSGSGIYINGGIKHTDNCPIINLSSTTNITSLGNAIYAAGFGEWNINGSTMTGVEAGLAIKSGKFVINNAGVTATGEDKTPTAGYGNGINSSGAAIQIESNKGYARNITLNIKSGTFKSEKGIAFYEYLADGTTDTSITSLKIENGTFNSATNKNAFAVSEEFRQNIKKFITGGKFRTDVTDYIADGYVCKKIDNEYVVGKEKNITVKDVEGGKVIANPTKAISGETIILTVVPDEGYKLEKIEITDGRMGDALIGTTTFKMLIGDTEVIPVFTKLKTDTEVSNNVDNAKKVESMLIETLKENKELAEAIKDKNVEIKVEVKEKEVTKTEKETIETAVNKKDTDLKVANYIDITITVKDTDNGDSLGKLSTVKETITFTVAVPENLPELAEGYERVFYIVRNHDGEIELLDATEANGKLKFESDKFSTYAIAYKDVKKATDTKEDTRDSTIKDDEEIKNVETNNPKTGDNIIMYVSIAIAAVAGIIILKKVNATKKRKH